MDLGLIKMLKERGTKCLDEGLVGPKVVEETNVGRLVSSLWGLRLRED